MKTLTPNDFGKTFMVEECPKIKIDDFLKRYRNRLKELMLSSEMEISGWRLEIATSKTHYNGLRLWFKCPICELRAGVVFKHPITNAIGCRQCLKLEYRKRRYKDMVENDLPPFLKNDMI